MLDFHFADQFKDSAEQIVYPINSLTKCEN